MIIGDLLFGGFIIFVIGAVIVFSIINMSWDDSAD